jgi:glutamate/tyrosine decarboxylase-like PLP-dependent enzyme
VTISNTAAPADAVLAELAGFRDDDLPVSGGTTTAYVFDAGVAGLEDLAVRAHALMAPVNGLDPTQFPSVARIENDLIRTASSLLGGDDATVGTVTSGGTESCLLAVLGARELWRAQGRTGRPQLVVPSTVHAAFHKAAHLFDLDLVWVDVDPATQRADAAAMAEAIEGPIRELLEGKNFSMVATIRQDGTPHVVPTWVDTDGSHVLLNSSEWRAWAENLRRTAGVEGSSSRRSFGRRRSRPLLRTRV